MRLSLASSLLLIAVRTPMASADCDPTVYIEYGKYKSSATSSSDWFGWALDLEGSLAVVSAVNDGGSGFSETGSVFIFEQDDFGVWTEQTQLVEGNGRAEGDFFGTDVGISGTTVVVGADSGETGGTDDIGIAVVFVQDEGSTTWSQEQVLAASDGAENDRFGWAVDVDGDTIVVGAPNNNAAYVFTRTGGVWTEQQILTPESADLAEYGTGIAVEGDIVVVGTGVTVAEVWERSGSTWARLQVLSGNSGMGRVADINGGRVVVGVWDSAEVYIYEDYPYEDDPVVLSDGLSSGDFGRSVSLNGNLLAVGAPQDAGDRSGRAYLFEYNTTIMTWELHQEIMASDAESNDRFGVSTGITDQGWLVGARFEDDGGSNSGALYAFVKDPCTEAPSTMPSLAPSSSPTISPSLSPTMVPSSPPTSSPTIFPSSSPTLIPSSLPTMAPTSQVDLCFEEDRCGLLGLGFWMHRDRLGQVTCRNSCTFAPLVRPRKILRWECGRCERAVFPPTGKDGSSDFE